MILFEGTPDRPKSERYEMEGFCLRPNVYKHPQLET
jgi:hypothetical protein